VNIHSECITAMRQLRRVDDVSREFNEVYRGLTSDAKLGHEWSDLFMTKSILLRLVRNVFVVLWVCSTRRGRERTGLSVWPYLMSSSVASVH
jgi:hypothetical protein